MIHGMPAASGMRWKPLAVPPAPAVLVAIALAFLIPGVAGHDPWKTLDLVSIDVAWRMHLTGDWLVPRMAGDIWFEDAPVYHWLAMLFGKAFGHIVPFHDAARLASTLCALIAGSALYLAARTSSQPDQRAPASAATVLLLAGSVGLFVHAHEAIADMSMLAALALGLAALARAPGDDGVPRPALRALALGAALGAALNSGGWTVPSGLLAATLVAAASDPGWRSRRGAAAIGFGVLIGIVLAAAWPLAMWLRDPALLDGWLRYLLSSHGPAFENLRYYLATSGWFMWPAWPLALWALWTRSRERLDPSLLVPLAAFVAGFAALVLSAPTQDVNLTPLLAPLVLIASQGATRMLRGAAAALDWFGLMLFAFFTGVIWVAYIAMLTGVPAQISRNFLRVTPGFVQPLEPFSIAFSVVLLAAWILVMFRTARGPTRSLLRWAAGATLLWGSFSMLWMPWVDYQRSYRTATMQIKARIPAGASCITGRNLGNAQRAAFDYHAGIVTRPYNSNRPRACPLLLVQSDPRHETRGPGRGWVLIADAGRPGDKSERYRLYRLSE
jgi:4-amino-4-deoxy-L-arabinose transferase-like glycosyltransferase